MFKHQKSGPAACAGWDAPHANACHEPHIHYKMHYVFRKAHNQIFSGRRPYLGLQPHLVATMHVLNVISRILYLVNKVAKTEAIFYVRSKSKFV